MCMIGLKQEGPIHLKLVATARRGTKDAVSGPDCVSGWQPQVRQKPDVAEVDSTLLAAVIGRVIP